MKAMRNGTAWLLALRMFPACLALSLSLLSSLFAADASPQYGDWKAGLTRGKPGKFVPMPPGEQRYRIGWEALPAATGTMRFTRPKPGISKLEVEGGTFGFVRTLFRCDARGIASCDKGSLRPIRSRQAIRYRGGTSLTVIEFGKGEALASRGGVPANPPPDFFTDAPVDAAGIEALTGKESQHFEFPMMFDIQSAFLYVRSQPLTAGSVFRLIVVQENSAYLSTVSVLGRESVTVPAGKFPAIKLGLTVQGIDKDGNLKPYARLKRAQGWMTDDENRWLARVETEVFVGSVWATLEEVTPSCAAGAAEKRQLAR